MSRYILLYVIAFVLGACSSTQQHIADANVEYVEANAQIEIKTNDVGDLIAPYKDKMDSEMNMVLGMLPEPLKKDRPNSSMGNWFCDAMHYTANKHYDEKVHFTIQNYGGLRIPSVAKGPITKGKVIELMPFDNKLVVLKLSADELVQLARHIVEDRGWPMSEGIIIKTSGGTFEKVYIDGEELNLSGFYNVGMPDYVANGGGGCRFLKSKKQFDTGLYVRDAVIEYLMDMKSQNIDLTVNNTKRIQ